MSQFRVKLNASEGVGVDAKVSYESRAEEESGTTPATYFDQVAIRPGNGLFNIQSRIEEINASVKWKTSGGTQVSFQLRFSATENLQRA